MSIGKWVLGYSYEVEHAISFAQSTLGSRLKLRGKALEPKDYIEGSDEYNAIWTPQNFPKLLTPIRKELKNRKVRIDLCYWYDRGPQEVYVAYLHDPVKCATRAEANSLFQETPEHDSKLAALYELGQSLGFPAGQAPQWYQKCHSGSRLPMISKTNEGTSGADECEEEEKLSVG